MNIGEPLRSTLVAVAQKLAATDHEWWIISSAAVALHGGDPGTVRDVDVLIDPRDALQVFAALGLDQEPGEGTPLFRSDWFGTWTSAALPVELFAGFAVCEEGVWNPVLPVSRQTLELDGTRLYVPDRAELKAMLLRFGRAKDLARAATL